MEGDACGVIPTRCSNASEITRIIATQAGVHRWAIVNESRTKCWPLSAFKTSRATRESRMHRSGRIHGQTPPEATHIICAVEIFVTRRDWNPAATRQARHQYQRRRQAGPAAASHRAGPRPVPAIRRDVRSTARRLTAAQSSATTASDGSARPAGTFDDFDAAIQCARNLKRARFILNVYDDGSAHVDGCIYNVTTH